MGQEFGGMDDEGTHPLSLDDIVPTLIKFRDMLPDATLAVIVGVQRKAVAVGFSTGFEDDHIADGVTLPGRVPNDPDDMLRALLGVAETYLDVMKHDPRVSVIEGVTAATLLRAIADRIESIERGEEEVGSLPWAVVDGGKAGDGDREAGREGREVGRAPADRARSHLRLVDEPGDESEGGPS